jgi:RNA polymerase sigma factor (sigma-70 family)
MDEFLPPELVQLLDAPASSSMPAWETFLRSYSPLLLHAARYGAENYDDGMDAYAYVLDRLRADDFRKLRTFRPDSRARFSTWLVLVARRICVDRRRERYGRLRSAEAPAEDSPREVRRRLIDLTTATLDLDSVIDPSAMDAEQQLRREELHALVHEAIGELDPRDQLLLTLRFVEGLSARDIDAIQAWGSPALVYRRIEQLKMMLRRRLLRRGVDTPVP